MCMASTTTRSVDRLPVDPSGKVRPVRSELAAAGGRAGNGGAEAGGR